MAKNEEKIKLYSVDETAEILHLNPQNVRRLIRQNKLTATLVGNKFLMSEEQIKEFLENNITNKGKNK